MGTRSLIEALTAFHIHPRIQPDTTHEIPFGETPLHQMREGASLVSRDAGRFATSRDHGLKESTPLATTALSPQALAVLREAHCAANRLFITPEDLGSTYKEIKELCARLGGRWNTASQAFIFAYDPAPSLEVVLEGGEMPPKNPLAIFETPDPVSEEMLRYGFNLFGCNQCEGYRHNQPLHSCAYIPADLRILEPSAGPGKIARWIRNLYAGLGREDYTLHCCELHPVNRGLLRKQGFQVVADDFLAHRLSAGEPAYHIIMMNPPFLGHEYIDHIEHAWSLLDPREGRLVFVGPTGFTWHEDARCQDLRRLIRLYREDTPQVYPRGTFKASGAQGETALVSLYRQNQAWKCLPYNGFPNWDCYALEFHIAQNRELWEKRWAIWQQVDRGELPDSQEDLDWERTRGILRALFAEAVKLAQMEWIEIQPDETSLLFMEQEFLAYGAMNCECARHEQDRRLFWERAEASRQTGRVAESSPQAVVVTERPSPVMLHANAPLDPAILEQLTLF